MDRRDAMANKELKPVWICPKCGVRLVSKNLWHACGDFKLEDLFKDSKPGVLQLAKKYVEILNSLGDVQVLPQKSRLTCVARVRFAGLLPRKDGFLASFALRRWLESPRIHSRNDLDPRWRIHRVLVKSESDIDDELRAWLQESHDEVGMQSDLADKRRGTPKPSFPSARTSRSSHPRS